MRGRIALNGVGVLILLVMGSSCAPLAPPYKLEESPAKPITDYGADYLAVRRSHVTVLLHRGPAPWEWRNEPPPKGAVEIFYPSGEYRLKAWLALPANCAEKKCPAVIYFSGGLAMTSADFRNAKPFLEAGFAVFLPTLRAQNGNPGNFELFYGEVEDARAAVKWLASQSNIDATRIYTFGHSAGGAISALLSLWDDIPMQVGGSSGGLYGEDVFVSWRKIVPFDIDNWKERRLRVLVGNIKFMKSPHIAYVGSYDRYLQKVGIVAQTENKQAGGLLTVKTVAGTHGSSLKPAVLSFLELIASSPK